MNTDKAMANLDYKRESGDFYPTPTWATELGINALKESPFYCSKNNSVWEPACGDGAISKVLEKEFYIKPLSTDLFNQGYGTPHIDFLRNNILETFAPFDIIFTNPPYTLAEQFIRHALEIQKPHKGIVAMLLRNEYDCAAGRVDLFSKQPFSMKLVLTSRPRWIEGTTVSPRHNYAWYFWDWSCGQEPIIKYGIK